MKEEKNSKLGALSRFRKIQTIEKYRWMFLFLEGIGSQTSYDGRGNVRILFCWKVVVIYQKFLNLFQKF